MRKSQSIVCMSLLTVSLMIPIGRPMPTETPLAIRGNVKSCAVISDSSKI